MKLTVKIDKDLCIGAASCLVGDPDHFELNAEGKAQVKQSVHAKSSYETDIEVDEVKKKTILLAAASCPTQAISVFDENGIQLFP